MISSTEVAVPVTHEAKSWRRFVDPLILVTLGAFAVTQPLLSDFRDGAGYFVARRTEPIEIVLLVVVLTLLPGLMANMIVWAAGGFSEKAQASAQTFFVALFAALIFQTTALRLISINWVVSMAIAGVVGGVAAVAYRRSKWFRTFLVYLIPAPLVFALFFLLTPPVLGFVLPPDPKIVGTETSTQTPVVFVVFDEFPVVSLLNRDGAIDTARYPNFARLASMSTWYKYTTAAHDNTMWAIPSLLSGQLPRPSSLATAANYPGNLFTLLDGSYKLHVSEPFTHLCPPETCSEVPRTTQQERLRSILVDSARLYAMMLWPVLETSASIQDPFHEFTPDGAATDAERDPVNQFAQFLTGITSAPANLYFVHVLLPHIPFRYYPSGVQYNDGGELAGHESEIWVNAVLAEQALQRHMLQVQTVDRVVGDLLDKLESHGILDESLVVVTADHGASFREGVPRRAITAENAHDVGLVPLFIKAPHQARGSVNVDPARSIDVLPTVAAHLGVELPWLHDGQSLLSPRTGGAIPLIETDDDQALDLADLQEGLRAASTRLASTFGGADNASDLYAFGDYASYVGRSTTTISAEPSSIVAHADEAWRYAHVAPYTGFVPGFLHGYLTGPVIAKTHVAVAVNGEIRTVVPVFQVDEGKARFSAIIPDDAFISGFNELQLLALSRNPNSPQVQSIDLGDSSKFRLEMAPTGRVTRLIGANGEFWPIAERSTIIGYVEAAEWYYSEFPVGSPKDLQLPGWAIRLSTMEPVEEVVFFTDGIFAGSVRPDRVRADIEDAYESADVRFSGFVGRLPHFLPSESLNVRAFALSDGVAEELPITDAATSAIRAG